jgi:hypothetical protein
VAGFFFFCARASVEKLIKTKMNLSTAGTLRLYMFCGSNCSLNSNLEQEKLPFSACMCLHQVKTLQGNMLWGNTWKQCPWYIIIFIVISIFWKTKGLEPTTSDFGFIVRHFVKDLCFNSKICYNKEEQERFHDSININALCFT